MTLQSAATWASDVQDEQLLKQVTFMQHVHRTVTTLVKCEMFSRDVLPCAPEVRRLKKSQVDEMQALRSASADFANFLKSLTGA